MEAGVALVDIGGGTTDICIFDSGKIVHTAIIPIGGDRITQDLQEAFGILKDQAEEVKVKYGSCFSLENMKNEVVVIPGLPGRSPREISVYAISQVIKARMEDIVQKVDFEIQLSGIQHRLNGGIVLTGGGSSLKDINQFFSYNTGLDVHLNSPGQHLGKGMIEEVRNPMYSTAIGLVMKGIETEQLKPGNHPNVHVEEIVQPKSTPQPEPVMVEEEIQDISQNKKKGISWKSLYPGNGIFKNFISDWISDDADDFHP
jgi:cell division protein FtsA